MGIVVNNMLAIYKVGLVTFIIVVGFTVKAAGITLKDNQKPHSFILDDNNSKFNVDQPVDAELHFTNLGSAVLGVFGPTRVGRMPTTCFPKFGGHREKNLRSLKLLPSLPLD